jgi:hypothetical protein
MTTINEVTQKQSWMETFDNVVALYSLLKTNSMSLRVKQAMYRQDEVAAEPLDFIIDVEIKVKRAVGQRFYDIFLRAVYNENTEILSETLREALGRTFVEHGLGPDGAYRRLYYKTKNEQIRSYMKGTVNGTFRADDTGNFSSGNDCA